MKKSKMILAVLLYVWFILCYLIDYLGINPSKNILISIVSGFLFMLLIIYNKRRTLFITYITIIGGLILFYHITFFVK